jgi:hypothetical protein
MKVSKLKLKDKDSEKKEFKLTVPVSDLVTDPATTLRITVSVKTP